MARKRVKTSTDAVIPPAKVQIDGIIKDTYRLELPIIPTGHAKKRLQRREVSLQDIRQVLTRSGSRASEHDKFHTHDEAGNEINRWSYGFVGRTTDKRKLRVCVSVVEKPDRTILIVTVCDEE